ncbi:single-stranded DNA-binding protein [Candidatus Peregrinibacteria bacterium CG10_big_fil_rev_8_21_14_0_10_36_19]|nr:MAG: single-stranded DNA-binding protein [Candidatus Peregrinibacteria bacterium CG10_big_fil_rev_8_21_14_0_10_36_19]
MRHLNRVTFIGRLAADPDLRQTKDGKVVVNFPVAINRKIKGDGDQLVDAVDFHRVVVFSGLADIANRFLTKGSPIYLEGRLINNSYNDSDGNKQWKTEIVADSLNILSWNKKEDPAS